MIPPNEQVLEEIKPSIPIIPKVPSKDKPNALFPKVALMVKSFAQVTKRLKKNQRLEPYQTLHFSQDNKQRDQDPNPQKKPMRKTIHKKM